MKPGWLVMGVVLPIALGVGCGSSGAGPSSAPSGVRVGFRVIEYAAGRKAAVWYPTTAGEGRFVYPGPYGFVGRAAPDGAVDHGASVPLVVFSHGDGGCGTQSIYLTEELARHGYVVAAPDHADASCSVDGGPSRGPDPTPEPPFTAPELFTDESYAGRKDDVETLLAVLLSDPDWQGAIDAGHVAISGHSLGGYTGAALAGAWASWKDDRFEAALLLSPYVEPYLLQDTISAIDVPVMYQGGTLDTKITPFLVAPNGAYARANPPRYFAELRDGDHLAWTNVVCAEAADVADCLSRDANARLVVDYSAAFFDLHLKGIDQPLLRAGGDGLALYRADPGAGS